MFEFTKTEYEYICNEAMLNEDYCKLLEMEIKDYSNTKIAMELNISERTLTRGIKELKKKILRVL